MPPVKFDDIGKTSKEVLSDDYQTSGYQFKAKQKTSFNGAVLTSTVDLFPAKDSCMTPAKLSWKLPTPLGCPIFCIDKLELDKAGGIKAEASSDWLMKSKNLKVEVKSDVADLTKATAGFQYLGCPQAQVKFETKVMKPQDCVFELTYAPPIKAFGLTLGVKGTGAALMAPDLATRIVFGGHFASLYARQKFSAYSASYHYKCSDKTRWAATYEYGGKANGQFALGITYDVKACSTKIKAKVQQDKSISCSVKHDISKGFTVLAGAKVDAAKMELASWGVQLSIE